MYPVQAYWPGTLTRSFLLLSAGGEITALLAGLTNGRLCHVIVRGEKRNFDPIPRTSSNDGARIGSPAWRLVVRSCTKHGSTLSGSDSVG